MATDPVVAYLDYLQHMARKIAYRGTTVDVLSSRSRRLPDRYLSYDAVHEGTVMQRYLKGVADDQQVNEGRTLFIGIGLVVGTTKASGKSITVSAPLVMVPCEVEDPDDTDPDYSCSPEWSAASLNYDLISAMVDRSDAVDAEDSMGMPDLLPPAVTTAMDRVERMVRGATSSRSAQQLLCDRNFADEVAVILRSEIPSFRGRIAT